MDSYKEKLEKEKLCYIRSGFQENHFLNSRLFYSPYRKAFSYVFPKKQLSNFVGRVIRLSNLSKPRILVAPMGDGNDIAYVKHFSDDISGIDISEVAINSAGDQHIKKYAGDIKNMNMFADSSFDIAIVPLFFHHYVMYGFDDFLKELYRVLKPGGHFFSLEPSSLYPGSWLAWFVKKFTGNITGAIDGEKPFLPFKLLNSMKKCGFCRTEACGASFSHSRFPIFIAKINNAATVQFLRFPVIKYFAWQCIFYGKK